MNYYKKFQIKEEHLKLLKNFNVDWYNSEYGAPMINPKRPYGNSDVELDIAEILEWEIKNNELSDEQSNEASKLHEETKIALQICLSLLKFETGLYGTEDPFLSDNWKKIKDCESK